jgi:hypothetical protein
MDMTEVEGMNISDERYSKRWSEVKGMDCNTPTTLDLAVVTLGSPLRS